MTNTRWIKWSLLALIVVLLSWGIVRAIMGKQAQQAALLEHTERSQRTVIELSAADIYTLQVHELTSGLPVSGTLKAVNSAWLKVRVPGELQDLRVREGDAVQAGQVIARIDPAESEARLRQAQLQADAAKAQIDIARRQYDNNKALVDQGFISKTALDTSQANLNAALASHAAAVAATDVARKSASDTVLRAPMSGLVSQRLAQPGERVSIDARIVEIVDLSHMEIEAALSAADSTGVRVGQQARLQVEGLAQTVPARVARINPSTQAGSRSVLVYLQLQPVAGLRQGLFVQGTLDMGKFKALAVPLQSVRTDKPSPYVQVVVDGQVQHVAVTLGLRGASGGQAMVAVQGLPEGSEVLVGAVGSLRDGTVVRRIGAAKPSLKPVSPPGQ